MKLKFLWWAVLGGAVLTLVSGALAYFGGGLGYRLAQLLSLPAVGFSYVAYYLGLLPLVDGLLADPGGTFCFATREQRLLSHFRSAFPVLTVVAGIAIVIVAKARRGARLG
jgi:hypothetical protein